MCVGRRSAVLRSTGGVQSEDEISGRTVGDSSSVVSLGGFTSGFEFALVSDFSTVRFPSGGLGLGLGLVNGLASLEAKLARGSVSLDDLRVLDLGDEERLSDGVEGVGDHLSHDVVSLELNIKSVVKIFNSDFSSHGVTVLEVVENGVSLLVVIEHEGKHLDEEEHEDADQPNDGEDLGHSIEELVEDGVAPSEAREGPREQHDGPSDDVHVESDVRCGTEQGVESHLIPARMIVVHVLSLVEIEVVQHIEGSKGSVDGPSEVSSSIHSLFLGLLGSSAFIVCVADKHGGYRSVSHLILYN